jgi:hypothetical protein
VGGKNPRELCPLLNDKDELLGIVSDMVNTCMQNIMNVVQDHYVFARKHETLVL